MSTLIITQARYGSSRLSGKVLKKINEKTLLEIHLSRLKRSKLADKILVATTNEVEAAQIVEIAKNQGCLAYQGSLTDVLDRFYKGALTIRPSIVVRVTSDCPFIDGTVIDEMINQFNKSDCDYLSNVHPPTYPDGIDIEMFTFQALERAWNEAISIKEREHVTPYIWGHSKKFKLQNFTNKSDMSKYRLTVDTAEDFELIAHLVEEIGEDAPWQSYVDYLEKKPDIMSINHHFNRNEGY